MKVSTVNNNINFTRAIRIQNYPINSAEQQNKELANILNGEKSKMYSTKESRQIRAFFRQILGDYNSQNKKILFRKTNDGDAVLLSGKDAENIINLEGKKRQIWNNKELSRNVKLAIAKRKSREINDAISRKIEDGKKGKPNTTLRFEVSTNSQKQGKITHIDYSSMSIEYSVNKNDHILSKEEYKKATSKEKSKAKCFSSIAYEEKSLNLKA